MDHGDRIDTGMRPEMTGNGSRSAACRIENVQDQPVVQTKQPVDGTAVGKIHHCNILAAMLYRVAPDALESRTRHERRINEARQLAMYLANVCLGIGFEDIALAARRDRTTVRYSVERVEDRRENPQFDLVLVALETLIACFQDAGVSQMIEEGLRIDHDLVAYIPKAD